MGFEALETSSYEGEPRHLYTFTVGQAGTTYRFTDHERAVTSGGERYIPMPISFTRVEFDGRIESKDLTIQIPEDSDIGRRLSFRTLSQVVKLRIEQFHAETETDPEIVGVFSGVISSIASGSRKNPVMKLTCTPGYLDMERVAGGHNYQVSCPYALYGPDCRAMKVKRVVRIQGFIDGGFGILVDTAGIGEFNSPFYASGAYGKLYPATTVRGGTIEWDTPDGTEIRTVVGFSDGGEGPAGRLVALHLSDRVVQLGREVISFYPGCNRTMKDCRDVHDNLPNFGGQPWIPLRVP